jgi:probable blue pigment (indigoidine) exporter
MSLWFSAGYAIAGAATELTAGVASRSSSVQTVLLWAAPSALVVAVVAALVNPGPVMAEPVWLGFLAGIVGGAALPVAFYALAIGPIGVVASVIACTSTIALGFAGIVTQGVPSGGVWIGMALCVIALISLGHRRARADTRLAEIDGVRATRPRALVLAMTAGLGYAGFTFLMSLAEQNESGPIALVAARAAVVLVACCLLVLTGPPQRPTVAVAAFSVSAGILDVAGNLLLLAALATTPLITVAIVGATSPGLAAVGAAILLNERLTGWQVGGITLAAMGAVLAATT